MPEAIRFDRTAIARVPLRRGLRAPLLLARLVQIDARAQALPRRLPRQGQPGALLLGRLRPGGDALLGADGAAAPGRHPARRRRGDARGVFSRGEQRRLLARRRRFPEAAFYAYAYPEPAGFKDAAVRPDAARFDKSLGEFVLPYAAVRAAPRSGGRSARVPGDDVRRRRRPGALGSARPGTAAVAGGQAGLGRRRGAQRRAPLAPPVLDAEDRGDEQDRDQDAVFGVPGETARRGRSGRRRTRPSRPAPAPRSAPPRSRRSGTSTAGRAASRR